MKVDLGEVLADQLRRVRESLGLTQEEFAEQSGFSQPRVSRLERNAGWKTVRETGQAIADAGGDPLDLFRVQERPASKLEAEIRHLLLQVDEETLEIVLAILKREVSRAASKHAG